MTTDFKLCCICDNKIYHTVGSKSDFQRKKCCSDDCKHESRKRTMAAKGQIWADKPRPKKKASEASKIKAAQREKEFNAQGKRKKPEPRLKKYDALPEEKHPLNIAQALHEANLRAKEKLTFESKIYTPEEIEQVRHQITPIHLVKRTEKHISVFAEIDITYKPSRRHEDNGSLVI